MSREERFDHRRQLGGLGMEPHTGLTNISAAEMPKINASFPADLHVDPELDDCIY
jgi:hypothetical protein